MLETVFTGAGAVGLMLGLASHRRRDYRMSAPKGLGSITVMGRAKPDLQQQRA